MKPERLRFQGVNSYADECVIDFSALHPYGLFGIFGPTGSGKSTILDAISLALFDEMPRSSNKNTKEGAGNSYCKKPFVEFEFTHRGERYRVRREYSLNKETSGLNWKKGVLERLEENGWRPLAGPLQRNVNRAVKELLGLQNVDDFFAAVLLPQGEFTRFLKSPPTARADMLARLFGLEHLEKGLWGKIKSYSEKLEKAKKGVEGEIEAYKNATDESIRAAEARLAEIRDEVAMFEAQKRETDKRLDEIRTELQDREAAKKEKGEAESELLSLEKERKAARGDVQRIEKGIEAIRRELEEMQEKGKRLAARAEAYPRYTALSERLGAIRGRERELAELEKKLTKAAGKMDSERRKAANLLETAGIEGPPDELERLLEVSIAKAERRVEEIRRRREELLTKESAAALAALLKSGEPCPVCGSSEHPSPAVRPDTPAGKLEPELKKAEKRLKSLKKLRSEAAETARGMLRLKSEMEAIEADRTELNKRISSEKAEFERDAGCPPDEFPALFDAAKEAWLALEALKGDIEKFRERLEAEAEKLEPARRRLSELEGKIAAVENANKAAEAKLKAVSERLAHLRAEPDPAELAKKLQGKIDELRRNEGKLTERMEKLRSDLERKRTAEERLSALQMKLALVDEIKSLCSGGKLASFAAAHHLRQILGAASRLLRKLTSGKYSLVLKEESKGVGISLADDWSGGELRTVNSLSGGETFLASFALALAISESIRLKSDIEMQCLFVDEGFGSLDSDSLRAVFDAIQGLVEDERRSKLTGLISHVEEMKEWMQAWIEVTPPREGEEAASSRAAMRFR